jgi:hypothetical protein
MGKRYGAHLIDTPKHLMAMAASKKTAARGKVRLATAKKEERRCGVWRAQAERRYRPNAPTAPENAQVNMPGMIPTEARAYRVRTGEDINGHELASRSRTEEKTYPRKGKHA